MNQEDSQSIKSGDKFLNKIERVNNFNLNNPFREYNREQQ